jgi:ABC-type Fe3+-hydroxamate transport system substrate-binding protein
MANEKAPAETPTVDAAPATPKKSATRFVTPILALVAALAIGGIAGVVIGQNTAQASAPGFNRGQFPGAGDRDDAAGGFPGGGRGDVTSGTVTSIDGSTITVTLQDGSTVTVTTTADTTVTKTTDATVADLAAGEDVVIAGTKDDSGTVTATSITQGARFPGGIGGFAGGTPPTQGDDD